MGAALLSLRSEEVRRARAAVWDAFLRLHNGMLQSRGAQQSASLSWACGEALDDLIEAVARAVSTAVKATTEWPLAPICYICGCPQTAEHAALPHGEYGVIDDQKRACCGAPFSERHADNCARVGKFR